MAKKDIQKALEEAASAAEDKATVDNEVVVNAREAKLLARKRNLQRNKRSKIPSSLRWIRNLIKRG